MPLPEIDMNEFLIPQSRRNLKAIEVGFASQVDPMPIYDLNRPVSCGTTTICMEYDGGVVLGADSRTAMGTFIVSRVSDKLTKVVDNVYVCRSGNAAHTQALTDVVTYHMDFYKMNNKGKNPPVELAANTFQDLSYNYRDQLTCGFVVAGWDEVKGGQVYLIPLGGLIHRMPWAMGGSGSTYIYGYMDYSFKESMTKEEAIELTKTALAMAMSRDGSSGGIARVAVISKDGVERMTFSEDQKNLPLFRK
ncbi:uncharacterized protein LOC142344382 [Convolutriloba macropyga]|uniref:uncharacterized protein LOC142344382 n=1 Tax=Convolutriloba macropyga TaxID=536237 RepID=UPI003F526D05